MSQQRSLAQETSLTGIGLHTGEQCRVCFKPAPPSTGLVFKRVDLPGQPEIPAHPNHLCKRMRRTALAIGAVEIHTAEHMLAAASGLGLDNLQIEIDAMELPGLDGSAKDFVDCFNAAGIVEQGVARQEYNLDEPGCIDSGEASIIALPYPGGLKITYTLDNHGGAFGGAQIVEFDMTQNTFCNEVAPARTFCLASEVDALRQMGLGKGASTSNTLVFDGERIIDNQLRYADEAARHKILDIIGDLSLSTRRLNAHIIAIRSGHSENMRLVQAINKRIEISEKPKVVLDIKAILEHLPHRSPLLLLDRVVEFEPGKRIVGLKNVTINEPFFNGHFPGNPVMPGVLQIEALAQTGAVLLMVDPENQGKIPFFMSLDKVKFRRPVYPGDQMRLEVEVMRIRSRMAACKAQVRVEGEVCAEAEIRSVLMER